MVKYIRKSCALVLCVLITMIITHPPNLFYVSLVFLVEGAPVSERMPSFSVLLQYTGGYFVSCDSVHNCKYETYIDNSIGSAGGFNSKLQYGYDKVVVDNVTLDISYNVPAVLVVNRTEGLSIEDQVTTLKLDFHPSFLFLREEDQYKYIYVIGIACNTEHNVYEINIQVISSLQCPRKEKKPWYHCLSSLARKVTELQCSFPSPSVGFLDYIYPYIVIDDEPMSNALSCYRADIPSEKSNCLDINVSSGRSNFTVLPKSINKLFLQFSANGVYQTYSFDASEGDTKREETTCQLVNPNVFNCPPYQALIEDQYQTLSEAITDIRPQVTPTTDGNVLSYATEKGVYIASPYLAVDSGHIVLEESRQVCHNLDYVKPVTVCDNGRRIIVVVCDDKGMQGLQMYVENNGTYRFISKLKLFNDQNHLLNIYCTGEIFPVYPYVTEQPSTGNVAASNGDTYLPGGGIAGIVGCVILVVFSVVITVLVCVRKKRNGGYKLAKMKDHDGTSVTSEAPLLSNKQSSKQDTKSVMLPTKEKVTEAIDDKADSLDQDDGKLLLSKQVLGDGQSVRNSKFTTTVELHSPHHSVTAINREGSKVDDHTASSRRTIDQSTSSSSPIDIIDSTSLVGNTALTKQTVDQGRVRSPSLTFPTPSMDGAGTSCSKDLSGEKPRFRSQSDPDTFEEKALEDNAFRNSGVLSLNTEGGAPQTIRQRYTCPWNVMHTCRAACRTWGQRWGQNEKFSMV